MAGAERLSRHFVSRLNLWAANVVAVCEDDKPLAFFEANAARNESAARQQSLDAINLVAENPVRVYLARNPGKIEKYGVIQSGSARRSCWCGSSAIDRRRVDPLVSLVQDDSTIRPHPISIAPFGCFGHRWRMPALNR
jgi:hypothetical protein